MLLPNKCVVETPAEVPSHTHKHQVCQRECPCQAGDHPAALRLLAFTLRDLRGAEAYCRKHTGEAGYSDLLNMVLRPCDGASPRYVEACHIISVAGATMPMPHGG